MDKKKILIVASSFYPNISPRSFRTTELAKELARQGHDVVIRIPFRGYDYTQFAIENNLTIKDLGRIRFRDIVVNKNKLMSLFKRFVRRALGLVFEYPGIELFFKIAKALRHESGYDLMISVAVPYPVHWGVARARSSRNKIADVWVADCGDPYMGDTTDSFRKLFYFKYIEKWFCNKTDFITVPFEGAISAYYPEFHNKIRIIPQGIRLDDLDIPEYKKTTDFPLFAYAGGFIPGKRDPKALLNFLLSCDRDFKFIVYTSHVSLLLPFKNLLGWKLDIRDSIPREKLLCVLTNMDFLINFDNNTTTQLPSKLIDYAITGRPVLNITSESDFSLLLEFLNGNYSSRLKMESPQKYNIRVVAQEFVDLHREHRS
jgi:glycosyltransferase involved in cell wall biosynthesis